MKIAKVGPYEVGGKNPIILLAGGYDKKTGFNELKPYLEDLKALIVFCDTIKSRF